MKLINSAVFLLLVLFQPAYSQMSFDKFYPVSDLTSEKYNSISYSNGTFLVAGDNGLMIRSTDDGKTWNNIQAGLSNHIYDLDSYMAVCSGGKVLSSNNGGLNWILQNTGINNDLHAIMYAQYYYTHIIVGDGGCILFSRNSGVNWLQVPAVTTNNLSDVKYTYCLYGYTVFACGNQGTVVKSYVRYSNPNTISFSFLNTAIQVNLNSICPVDSNIVIAVGDYGKIFRTTNGGINWSAVNSPVSQKLNCLSQTSYPGSRIFAGGENGVVIVSADSGASWQQINSGISNNITSLYSDVLMTYAVTNPGQVLKCYRTPNLEGRGYRLQSVFESKKIKTYISTTGIFNQDFRTSNTPGFSWPSDSNRFAIFTTGLSIAAKFNNGLRLACASYNGEYLLGSMNNQMPSGNPYYMIYSVKKGDNSNNNIWWANWDKMVPFGAPYVDVNNNGVYDPCIDTPGVKNAYQTVFVALTDGYPNSHNQSEGLSGGTQPLYADLRLTAWSYSEDSLADVQFFKFRIINKSNTMWDSVHFCFFSDVDLGYATDDNIGCDTSRNLAFCLNADNMDGTGNPPSYGLNPPAVGFKLIKTPVLRNIVPPEMIGMTSFCTYEKNSMYVCEREPGMPYQTFNFLHGLKGDRTPFLDASKNPPVRTKYEFYGDPETNTGWTETKGIIHNCSGDSTGTIQPHPPGDRRFFMNTGSDELQIYPGEEQTIVLAQLIKRGANNLNAVTKLKEYSDYIESFYNTINTNQVIPFIPDSYMLFQNYPNPFNAVTRIKYQLNYSTNVKLKVFDILGREVATLVNQYQNPGLNVYTFDGSQFASGVYFYRLETDKSVDVKKMVLIK